MRNGGTCISLGKGSLWGGDWCLSPDIAVPTSVAPQKLWLTHMVMNSILEALLEGWLLGLAAELGQSHWGTGWMLN